MFIFYELTREKNENLILLFKTTGNICRKQIRYYDYDYDKDMSLICLPFLA